MQIGGLQQLLTYSFTRAALKENIIRNNNCCFTRCFHNRIDVLNKIKLFVRACCPEILTVINEIFFLFLAFFVCHRDG